MSEFQRFVSYIYLYEENRKVRNLGFAKIENRGGQCKIEIHMRGTGYTGISCPAYLFVRKSGKMEGIFLGKIPIQNGNGEGRFQVAGENINESGYGLEQISGFLIFVNDKIMFASQWDEQEIRREWFVLPEEKSKSRERPKEEQKQSPDPSDSPKQLVNPNQPIGPGQTKQAQQPNPAVAFKPAAAVSKPAARESAAAPKPTAAARESAAAPKPTAAAPKPTAAMSKPAAVVQPVAAASSEIHQPTARTAQPGEPREPDDQSRSQGITATEAATAQRILPSQSFSQRISGPSVIPVGASSASGMKASPASRMQKAASSAMLVQKAASSAAAQRNVQSSMAYKSASAGNRKNGSSAALQKDQSASVEEQEQPWEQKWKFLLENYPVLTPFEGEEGILCIRMELRDLRTLPKRYWYLGNNSFLLHGFFNYRYLIFGKEETEEGKKWFLGVPGVFQSQEKVMASIFGFPEYRSEKKSGQKTGQFGYWYRYIELGQI